MNFAAGTDKGRHRELNEDFYSIIPGNAETPPVFVIADGMGGHNSGEIASKAAVDFIGNAVAGPDGRPGKGDAAADWLKKIITDANRHVYEMSLELPSNNGMGTTLTIAAASEGTLYIGHIGDSRLYLIRGGIIKLLTTDHSYIEEMVRNGSISREEAKKHPRKNVITRALGCNSDVEADLYDCDMEPGDAYVMCTDGLTNMLGDDEIAAITGGNPPEAACGELIKRANENGGEDNITVIVIKNE